jgi:hypothetical protein
MERLTVDVSLKMWNAGMMGNGSYSEFMTEGLDHRTVNFFKTK